MVIEMFNGRNSSLDYVRVKRDYNLLDFDPRTNDFTHFMKALESFRDELHRLDSREQLITDDELLEKTKATLIQTFRLGNYRTTDNNAFNNFLYELSLELISAKTTIGFEGRHKDSFRDFGTLNATVRLLA